MVPNGWELKRLEELCSPDAPITYGVLKPGDFYQGGIPLLQIKDLRDGEVITNDLHLISPALDEEYKRSRIIKDDILISLVGTIGRIAKYRSAADANIHRNIGRIRSEMHEYLYHFLKSNQAQNEIGGSSSGSSQSALNLSTLRSMKIPVPPLPEQKKIAQILSTWDKAITTTEKLLANSQQQKKALMQQLLTGKKRLLDKNGARFSGEWKKGKLSDIANIDSGYAFKSNDFTDSDKGIPIIRMSDFKAGGIDISSAAKVIPESTIGLDRFKLKTGDFVFGMSGSLSNYGWVKEQDLPCFLNQRVGRILAKECAVQLFVTYLYLSDKIQQSILDKAAGAAQLNISSTDLRTTIVHYPSYEEQQKIAAVLSNADQEISALQQKLNALKQEKKALMQQLLTGKRRVLV